MGQNDRTKIAKKRLIIFLIIEIALCFYTGFSDAGFLFIFIPIFIVPVSLIELLGFALSGNSSVSYSEFPISETLAIVAAIVLILTMIILIAALILITVRKTKPPKVSLYALLSISCICLMLRSGSIIVFRDIIYDVFNMSFVRGSFVLGAVLEALGALLVILYLRALKTQPKADNISPEDGSIDSIS